MKRAFKIVFYIFLITVCFIIFPDSKTEAAFSSGTGTTDDPYIITTSAQFDEIRNNLDKHFVLGNDIDLSALGPFAPIGDYYVQYVPSFQEIITPFTGSLDGAGHAIKNLEINQTGKNYVGLFAVTDGSASIKNVTLENVTVSNDSSTGALVGYLKGFSEISDIHVTGNVNGGYDTGGLIGYVEGTGVIHSINSQVDVTGANDVGGIFGYLYLSSGLVENMQLTNLKASGSISGDGYLGGIAGFTQAFGEPLIGDNLTFLGTISNPSSGSYIGGIFGYLDGKSQLKNINFDGSINTNFSYVGGLTGYINSTNIIIENAKIGGTISSYDYVGGLIGKLDTYGGSFSIKNVIEFGNVHAIDGDVGGLFGYVTGIGTLESLVNTGVVTSGSLLVGGIAGTLEVNSDSGIILKDSYTTGEISGTSFTGGLVGEIFGATISNSYSSSTVNANEYVGGLVGKANGGTIQNSFALNPSVGQGSPANAGRILGLQNMSYPLNLLNNQANVEMVLPDSLSEPVTSNALGIHGEDIALDNAKLKATFANVGWDFNSIWDISEGNGFPTLKFNAPPIPVITLNGEAVINIVQGDGYSDVGATAVDKNGTDISGDIVMNGTVDTSIVGTYFITYDVTDSDGNKALTVIRTVVVSPKPENTTAIQPVFSVLNNSKTEIDMFFIGELDLSSVPNNSGFIINNQYSLVSNVSVDHSSPSYTKVTLSLIDPLSIADPTIKINAGTLKNKDGKWNVSITQQVTQNLSAIEKVDLDTNGNGYLDIADVLKIASTSSGEGPILDGEFNEFDILFLLTQIDRSIRWTSIP